MASIRYRMLAITRYQMHVSISNVCLTQCTSISKGPFFSRYKALNSSVLLHSSLYMLYTFECRWVLGHRTVCLPCTVRPSNDCNLCNVYRFAPRQCMPVRYATVRDSFVCMFGTHARHMSCFPDKLHPHRSLDPLLGRGSCSMLLWV